MQVLAPPAFGEDPALHPVDGLVWLDTALHAHESTVSVDEGAARRRRDVQGLTFQLRAAPGTELRQGSTVRFLLRPLLQWDRAPPLTLLPSWKAGEARQRSSRTLL